VVAAKRRIAGLLSSAAMIQGADKSELATALRSYWAAFVGIGISSAVINVLYLTGSFFMLEVYDRVLPSKSLPTLVGLLLIAVMLYAFQVALDIARGRLLIRVGIGLDEVLNGRVYHALLAAPVPGRRSAMGIQPLHDLDQVRGFMAGGGPMALFDLPWLPLYLGICFAFHFWIGVTALAGAIVLVLLTLLIERLNRRVSMDASALSGRRGDLAESNRRNAEVIRAMGMSSRLIDQWNAVNGRYIALQRRAADVYTGFGSVSKVLRMLLQTIVLAVGAYLVIQQQSTSGIIIASSILTARALAPVELAIGNWRGFLAARQSWARLRDLLADHPPRTETIELAAPTSTLSVESVSVVPPGGRSIVVHDATLVLRAGQGMGIIGPSASGKSSLVKAIVGAWPVVRGKIRIDGAALDQWDAEKLGAHIGYVPQDIELFAGTIAQNIARFEPDAPAQAVIAAANAAGVHDLILKLPEGYETQVGGGGTSLSAGQRQRIALARALYKDPFLVVLDEPNSNLDQDGDAALGSAIAGIRDRGGIVIVVAHRPSVLASTDMLLVMADGGFPKAFGPRDQVLAKITRPPPAARRL